MLCRNLDGESLPNVFRLPAMEQRNLFTKTQADSVTEECEQETHKVSIRVKVGNSESVDSDSVSRLDSSHDLSQLQSAIYT